MPVKFNSVLLQSSNHKSSVASPISKKLAELKARDTAAQTVVFGILADIGSFSNDVVSKIENSVFLSFKQERCPEECDTDIRVVSKLVEQNIVGKIKSSVTALLK